MHKHKAPPPAIKISKQEKSAAEKKAEDRKDNLHFAAWASGFFLFLAGASYGLQRYEQKIEDRHNFQTMMSVAIPMLKENARDTVSLNVPNNGMMQELKKVSAMTLNGNDTMWHVPYASVRQMRRELQ